MKESITKFDLEAAFKALDEIDIPVAEAGIKANKPALTEIFSRKTKLDTLMEEYYDISNEAELDDAREAREAEVAQAKLARIEKIVDLDAESPEDLLPSYVGKFIIQCPQCMTLFYKNPEDVEASEEDPDTVNITEVCQHCGNEAGYTLIGKVGEATEEEAAEYNEEETVDVTSTEENEDEVLTDEAAEEPSEDGENFDLDELDLDIEDDEEAEKTEESFDTRSTEQTLVEGLTEEADLEVSADDFEKLINSSEFKKPISDTEARAMMDEAGEEEEVNESVIVNSETLRYAVINPDGTYAGAPCVSEEEARELAAQEEGRIIVELCALKEGVFDAIVSKLKSREAKADWLLANAMKDYNDIEVNTQGQMVPDKNNQRFKTFVVVGYTSRDNTGKLITVAPDFDDKTLVVGKNGVQYKTSYKDADKIAKGWSMLQGNGPAFIYLANGTEDDNALFLCEYFMGTLANDQLEKYIKIVKDHLKGAKLMSRGGMKAEANSTERTTEKPGDNAAVTTESLCADSANLTEALSPSWENIIKNLKKDGYDVTGVDNDNCYINLTKDGKDYVCKYREDSKDHYIYGDPEICKKPTSEDFARFLNGVEELQEDALESLISSSLVESYGNVAGFRLTECVYADNKLAIDGTIYFTSGNTRKTTYTFSEALTSDDGKVSLQGLNEKLGLDKQFTMTGYADSTKTFITESFTTTKK